MATKISKIIEMLKTGKYTIEELSLQSGASVGTVKMQLNFLLKKNGHNVISVVENDVKKFSIQH